MQADAIAYLKQKGIYITHARCALLLAFIKHKEGLSQRQLSVILDHAFDWVTLYRTLALFLKKGIIHVLPGIKGKLHYVLSVSNARHASRDHIKHLHFICKACGKATCLESVPTPVFQLPEGFIGIDTEVVVHGICSNCQDSFV